MKIKNLQQLANLLSDNSTSEIKITALTLTLNQHQYNELENELMDNSTVEINGIQKPDTIPVLSIKVYGFTFNLIKVY